MADAESEDHAPPGGVGNQGSPLRTQIRMAEVDICHPAADLNASRGFSHQLSCCQHVGIDLRGEDCLEAGSFSFSGNGFDVGSAPACPRDDSETHPFSHLLAPSSSAS